MALTPVRIDKSFKKRLGKKEPKMRASIVEAITRLRKDRDHPGLKTKSLRGQPGIFSARLDQGNRLTFCWDGDTIVLLNHCNHDILSGRKG